MRWLTNLIVTICEIIIVALLVIFAVENIRFARYTFIGNTFAGNVWWTVAGSALLGFIFALLMLAPGRVAVGMRSRTLGREHGRVGQELANLRGEHERLQAEHARVLNERDQLRSALAVTSSVNARNAGNAGNGKTATSYGATDGATMTDTDRATQTARTQTGPQTDAQMAETSAQSVAPQPQDGMNQDGVSDEANQPAAQDEGWRGRFRRLREGSGTTQDEMGTPNSPPAPTA
ncbi:MAG TPA: hypothetical protein VKT52_04695 [Ktedonobacterales bacterium]|nr:hypothetical protein [Ktedonobacterales bacterium]